VGMSRDAYELQGLNGWKVVNAGEEFTGRSRGFQVLLAGTFEVTCNDGSVVANTFTEDLPQGMFVGGVIVQLLISATGRALVFPMDDDFTIA